MTGGRVYTLHDWYFGHTCSLWALSWYALQLSAGHSLVILLLIIVISETHLALVISFVHAHSTLSIYIFLIHPKIAKQG